MLPKMATLLGYREQKKPKARAPSTIEQPPPKTPDIERGAADETEEEAECTPFWRLEECARLEEETPPDDVKAARPVEWRHRPKDAPEPVPLNSWRRLLPRLRRILALSIESRELDVDEIVNSISQGTYLARLPRQRRRRWCRELQIITDRSRRLTPFWEDQRDVSRRLKRLLPGHRVTFGRCMSDPSDIRLYAGSGPSTDYSPPAKGATVIVLGDLGCLAKEGGKLTRAWQAFGQRLAEHGCRLIALTPTPASRREDGLWQSIPWDSQFGCGPRGAKDCDRQAERLLMLLSPATRIEPGLLRAIRLLLQPMDADAGTEADVWQSEDLISKSNVAATLDPKAGKRLRAAFAKFGDETLKKQVLDTIKVWRSRLPDAVWFEELASLDRESRALLPMDEVRAADDYFEHVRWEFEGGAESNPDAWDDVWAESVLGRVPDYAWTPALYRLWWSVGDREGTSPPGFKPGLIGDKETPPRRLLLAQGDGLIVRTWSAEADPDPRDDSPLGAIESRSGYLNIEPVNRFWASGESPAWAHDWGVDDIGPWVTVRVEGENGGFVAQRMRWIASGRFLMGSPDSEPERQEREGPRHEVTISKGFWLFDTACNQGFWQAVMGENPSHHLGSDLPVESVSFFEVERFLERIAERVPGLTLTLPSEAQWEYACRAGTETPFSFGETIQTDQVNFDGNYPYGNSETGFYRQETVPVGSLPANPWGLFEMHGNVDEWCLDGLRDYRAQPVTDPLGPTSRDTLRVVRGGSWDDYARFVRSAFR